MNSPPSQDPEKIKSIVRAATVRRHDPQEEQTQWLRLWTRNATKYLKELTGTR